MRRIYTMFALLLLLLCVTTWTSAQVLIEDFNYVSATLLTANGWAAHSGAGTNAQTVTASGLTYTGYASSGIGNASSLATSGEDDNKTWASYPKGIASGTVYYSLMVNLSSAQTPGDYFFHLLKTSSIFTARLFAKKAASGNFSFGIAKSSTATNVSYTDSIYTTGTTYLIVVKLTMIAGVTNDTLALWVNPAISSIEPAPTILELSTDKTTADADTIYGVAIRQGSATNAAAGTIDGIRVGTTWTNSVFGVLEPTATITPASINFGNRNVGVSSTDTITVKNNGMGTLNLTSVASNNAVITVSPANATVLTTASQKFVVTYTPVSTVSSSAKITFVSNATTSPDSVIVTGSGIQSGFSMTPTSRNFGNVFKDSTKTDSVIVSNASTTAHLIIDSAKSSNPIFTITPISADLDTSSKQKFVITFLPTAKGAASGKIVFYHNAPSIRDTFAVSGNCILKEPLLTATPSLVDFKGILLNQTKVDSVTIKNTGYDSLSITNVAFTDTSAFTVTPKSAKLDTGASKKFYITFKPKTAGIKSAPLFITSNTSKITDTVKVTGNGLSGVSIAEARKDANSDLIPDHSITKDTLVIYGVVITQNMQGTQTSYFMQDSSAGINIFSFTLSPTFVIGDSVMVIGTVLQFRGLTEITPLTVDSVNFRILKHNAVVPKPKRMTVRQFVLNSENYEGQLIELDTLYKASGTWPAAGSNATIFVTNASKVDTTLMFIDLDTNIDGTPEPIYPINVVGVVSQFSSGSTVVNNGYEIVPRDTSDIHHQNVVSVKDLAAGIPSVFELQNNYPNPFNPSTTIMYGLPQQSRVSVTIYSVLGQELATLVNEVQAPSYYRIVWNGQDKTGRQVSSGVYFFRMVAQSIDGKAQSFVQVKKMLMMK